MIQDVQACGQGAFALVFLGIAGFVASFLAIVLASIRARLAGNVALGALALGLLTIVFSISAARRIDDVEAEAITRRMERGTELARPDAPRDLPRIDPAKGCVILGVQAGSMPILAGAIAFVWSRISKKKRAEPDLP